jgi:hypothetical protein
MSESLNYIVYPSLEVEFKVKWLSWFCRRVPQEGCKAGRVWEGVRQVT